MGYGNKRRRGALGAISSGIRLAKAAYGTYQMYKRFNPPKKNTTMNMIGQDMFRRRHRKKLGNNKLSKHLYNLQSARIERYQGLTNYDVNGGYFRLSNCKGPGDDARRFRPIHIYDLTSFKQYIGGALQSPEVGRHLAWTSEGAGANVTHDNLVGQAPANNGGDGSNTWQLESNNDVTNTYHTSVFMNWIEARFNLYGVRKRDTRFKIQLVTFPDDDCNLWHANPADRLKKSIFTYLEKPLVYNNLQTADPHLRKRMRVLASYVYDVPASTSIDLNTTTGKICEAKIFFRMNRAMALDWKDDEYDQSHGQGDGADWNPDTKDVKLWPKHNTRVFMIVSAFCPEQKTLDGSGPWLFTPDESYSDNGNRAYGTPVDTAIEPSYDLMIRRKYYVS